MPKQPGTRRVARVYVVGAASWLAMAYLLVQALRHDGTPAATMLALGPTALLATYALTSAWVWHNKHIYRVKGARRRKPYLPYPWTRDRLGREYAGSIAPACGRGEVVLSLVGDRKTYQVIRDLLEQAAASHVVAAALVFVAFYPLLTSAMWVATGLIYVRDRERAPQAADFYDIPDGELPLITILVPAFREGDLLDATLAPLCDLDYPRYEVLVIDDGSPDNTAEIARRYLAKDSRFGLLRKEVNEGKAMAMNDAIPLIRGEIVVVIDADAKLRRDALRYIAPHFVRLARVGAVTGNPRVANREGLVTELQTLEFTSIVSLIRRAQVVWGRVMTVSGVISAFRVAALRDAGLFDPSMATEDIELTWRLQRKHYDVRYEPRALVDMIVPATWPALWKQRRRWTTGLAQVLRHHGGVLRRWQSRRLWPVYCEAALSVLWSHAFMGTLALWAACLAVGASPPAFSLRPMTWGLLLGLACLAQLATGVMIDAKYDPSVRRSLWLAPVYPLLYWLMMAVVTVRSTIPALLKAPPVVAQWSTVRAATTPPAAEVAALIPAPRSEQPADLPIA